MTQNWFGPAENRFLLATRYMKKIEIFRGDRSEQTFYSLDLGNDIISKCVFSVDFYYATQKKILMLTKISL